MAPHRSVKATALHKSQKRDKPPGHLVIIGGAEDRKGEKKILRRFVELCGKGHTEVTLLTAASSIPEEIEQVYRTAFGELGVKAVRPIHLHTRSEANDPAVDAVIDKAGGIFMSGGNQKRLVAMVAGTRLCRAMHHAFARGCCIAGTSAGASAMSEHMLSAVMEDDICEPGPPHLDLGLGFMRRATIDQHFSERDRVGRLLSVVATNPYLVGVGIDEDTALVIEPHTAAEVVGSGSVTLIDCRDIDARMVRAAESQCAEPQLSNVRLHRLPTGFTQRVTPQRIAGDKSLDDILRVLVSVNEA
jgi:cyanophycinase